MQIRNDYTSYQGLGSNRNNHHQYVTDGLYEEVAKKAESGANEQSALSAQEESRKTESPQNIHMALYSATAKESRSAKKISWARRFWDYLGDEQSGEQTGTKHLFSIRPSVLGGINGAVAAFRENISRRIVNKWVEVRESIKTHANAALKKFGKGREAFTALSDQRMPSGNKEGQRDRERKREQIITRRGAVEVIIQEPVHNHLMDSYSKNGEYCKLNDHLTYRRPVSNQKVLQEDVYELSDHTL